MSLNLGVRKGPGGLAGYTEVTHQLEPAGILLAIKQLKAEMPMSELSLLPEHDINGPVRVTT